MKIIKDAVATLNYTLKVDGKVVDTTTDSDPIAYLHGHGDIFPKLEGALEGLGAGESVNITLNAEDAYGEYREELTDKVKKESFETDQELFVGQEFQFQTEDGSIHSIWVKEILESEVVVDGNHPLAGKTLDYSFEVVNVRQAEKEELEHGHVHGPGGHHH